MQREEDSNSASARFDRTIKATQLTDDELVRTYQSVSKAADLIDTEWLALLEAEVERRGLLPKH